MAVLDTNHSGVLAGSELGDLWIWLDADSDAVPDKGEIKPVTDYVTALSVRPSEIPGDNYAAKEGARLVDGSTVSTWDWWSGSFYPGDPQEYVPQTDVGDTKSPVVIYKWRQIDVDPKESISPEGKPARIPEGYFRFGRVFCAGRDGVMVASITTAAPAELRGATSFVTPYTHGGMEWTFGKLVTRAVLRPDGSLMGASYPGHSCDTPLYAWEAVPVTRFEDDYVSSLASFTMTELPEFIGRIFRYSPVIRGEFTSCPRKFLNLLEYVKSLEQNPLPGITNTKD